MPEDYELFLGAQCDARFEGCIDIDATVFHPKDHVLLRRLIFDRARQEVRRTSGASETVAEALDRCLKAMDGWVIRAVRQSLGEGDLKARVIWPYDGKKYEIFEEFWRTGEGLQALQDGYLLSSASTFSELPKAPSSGKSLASERVYFFVLDGEVATVGGEPSNTVIESNGHASLAPKHAGRPPEFPIEQILEIVCLYVAVEPVPAKQADFITEVQLRYGKKYNQEPSTTLLKNRLGGLYRLLLAQEQGRMVQ